MKLRQFLFCILISKGCFAQIFTTVNAHVDFISEAPLEIIEASTEQLQGVLNLSKNTFAFKMYIKSFDGFNSQLQRVHFYENYMEANDFPVATFKGKILEEVSRQKTNYRAKGILSIHGIDADRIIEIELKIGEEELDFSSTFNVALADHDIELPRIVYQKIAETIKINVRGTMQIKK